MTRKCVATVLFALTTLACATALQTNAVPAEFNNSSVQYFVENHGADNQGIDGIIAGQLRSRGLKATKGLASGRPAEFDVLVIYEDRWQWDMGNYLLFLRIDLRDPATNVLLATGISYQTSGARKAPGAVVRQIIDEMFGAH